MEQRTLSVDPVPWLTARWDAYGALTEAITPLGLTYAQDSQSAARVLDVLTSVVGGLGNDDRPYAVGFGASSVNTFTDLAAKTVTIGSGPLFDADLSPAQRAAVLTGLAFHEVGHVNHSRRVLVAVKAEWPEGHADRSLAFRLSNIADDLYSERRMSAEFPGLADTLAATMTWVSDQTIPAGTKASSTGGINLAVAATRYAHAFDWTGREAVLDWWTDWAERAAEAASPKAHVAVVHEAVDRIRSGADGKPEKPEQGDDDEPGENKGKGQPGGESTDDEPKGESEDGESEDGESEGEDKDKGEGKGESGESDDESDEKGDEVGGGTESDDPDDEDVPEGDDEGEDEPTRSDTSGTHGGGDGSEYGDDETTVLPSCPNEVAKDEDRDKDLTNHVAQYRRGQREGAADRSYNGHPVKRGKAFVTRGQYTVAETPGPEDSSFHWISPSLGHQVGGGKAGASTGTKAPKVRPDVARVLASSITSARTGTPTPDTGHRSGTLDRNRLARLGSGDLRVFRSPATPGPQRLRVAVLLDGSSSMLALMGGYGSGTETRSTVTAQIGVDLAGAFDSLPFVDAAIYVHNVNLRTPTVTTLWHKGEPVAYAGDYCRIRLDGNWDDYAIRFVTDDLKEATKGNERLLIVVVSDGEPPDEHDVRKAVLDAGKAGVQVLSVSVAPDLGIAKQRLMYGNNVVEYTPDPMTLAKAIAKGIGNALRTK